MIKNELIMNREDLIRQCRYYRGEEVCPYSDNNDNRDEMFWFYERIWVDRMCVVEQDEEGLGVDVLRSNTEEYKYLGLEDFEADDGTPITLKAILLNRLFHWHEYCTVEDFKKWYVDEYRNRERK